MSTESLPELEVGALANDRIVFAPNDVTIRRAAQVMHDESIGLLVLKDGEDIVGVVSERDIVRAVARSVSAEDPASSIGNGDIQYTSSAATVSEVANEMMESYIRHVLLAGPDGRLSSVVSVRDLLAVIVS